MEDNETHKIKVNRTEPLENPFNKLAPEVTGHILSFLNDHIPSLMAASGVCCLWRELVDWSEVKQLNLDFEHVQINSVSLEWHKWALALDVLLPRVELTSIRVTLPYKLPAKQDKYALSLFWPLSLIDSGVTITNHRASFSSVTAANIQGCPYNTFEFEFVCHLLELCQSLSELELILTVDRFPWSSLQWALRGQAITSLSLTMCLIRSPNTAVRVAQLCQVLAPASLKALKVITNVYQDPQHREEYSFPRFGTMPTFRWFDSNPESESVDPEDHLLCFDQFFGTLEANGQCVSALEHLHFGARQLGFSEQLVLGYIVNHPNFTHLAPNVLPKLRSIEFNIPDCRSGVWNGLYMTLVALSRPPFNHPVDVSLTSSHCNIMEWFAQVTEEGTDGDVIYLTEEGFNHHPTPHDDQSGIKFCYKRLPRTVALEDISCNSCTVCASHYQWLKGEIARQLRSPEAQLDEPFTCIFPCQFDRLKADLVDEFPTLEIGQSWDIIVITKAEGKEIRSFMGTHDDRRNRIGSLCAGCGIMSQ